MMRLFFLCAAPLLLSVSCSLPPPIRDGGAAADAAPLDGGGRDLSLCRTPCFADGSCPAAIYGVCIDGCCACRPPDGGLCPMFLDTLSAGLDSRSAGGSSVK
jgi:hypothetical protein